MLGIRKGQLRRPCKRHVLISGYHVYAPQATEDGDEKNRELFEEALVGEARSSVERAWANRRPDCDFLFQALHVGKSAPTPTSLPAALDALQDAEAIRLCAGVQNGERTVCSNKPRRSLAMRPTLLRAVRRPSSSAAP